MNLRITVSVGYTFFTRPKLFEVTEYLLDGCWVCGLPTFMSRRVILICSDTCLYKKIPSLRTLESNIKKYYGGL